MAVSTSYHFAILRITITKQFVSTFIVTVLSFYALKTQLQLQLATPYSQLICVTSCNQWLLCEFQALCCFRNLRSATEPVKSDNVAFQRDFIHIVEGRFRAITNLNYYWLAFFSSKSCISIDMPQDILFISINNREPEFQTTIDFILWLASFIFIKTCVDLLLRNIQQSHGLTSFSQ